MPLGKIQLKVVAELVKQGLLTPVQQATLADRPDDLSGAALDVLLEAEFQVDRFSLGVAWARALGIAFCDVTGHRVTWLSFEFIAENFCEDYLVLPVGQIGKALLVAVANPLAASLREMLEVMTGRRIVLLLALEKDLRLVFAQRRARHSGHAANFPAPSWAGVTLPQVGAEEIPGLAAEANRTLATALAARKWTSADFLQEAQRRVQEQTTGDQMLAGSLLGILIEKMKVLDESAILLQQMEADGIALVDLGTCVVPAEMVPQLDLEVCRATCSVPFGRAGEFTLLATAYHLSSAVRAFWGDRLGGNLLWYGATLAGVAGFLSQCAAVRAAERDAPGSRHPATDRAVQTDPLDSAVIPIPAELLVPSEFVPVAKEINRSLGEGLVERGLVTPANLTVVRELSRAAPGGGAILRALVDRMKVLREEDVLRHIAQQDGVAAWDPLTGRQPEAVAGMPSWAVCTATNTVPFGYGEGGEVLVATAFYLSEANRTYWSYLLGGKIRWFGVTRSGADTLLQRCLMATKVPPAEKPPLQAEPASGGLRQIWKHWFD